MRKIIKTTIFASLSLAIFAGVNLSLVSAADANTTKYIINLLKQAPPSWVGGGDLPKEVQILDTLKLNDKIQGQKGPNRIISLQDYLKLKATAILAQKLKTKKKINSADIKQASSQTQVFSDSIKTRDGIIAITGSSGVSFFKTDPGKYKLDSYPINNLDISIPSEVNVASNSAILVAISEGTGQVKKQDQFTNPFGPKKPQTNKKAPKVSAKTVVFYDQNKNGKLDPKEHILPWGGVVVKLTKN